MKLKTYVKKKPRIEMMPLIDTMFLLLVFFIYAMLSMVIHKGMDVSLPQGVTAQRDQEDYHVLSITSEGEWSWDTKPLLSKNLQVILSHVLQKEDDPRVYIRADKNAKHEWVLQAMDQLRQAGIEKMFFEMETAL